MNILRLALRDKEERAFTLIELLVVIIIIGILAGIAIPLFMNQQKTAVDSATTSDVRNVAANAETLRTKNPTASIYSISEPVNGQAVLTVGTDTTEVRLSEGTQMAVTAGDINGSYIICAWNTDGDKYATEARVWDTSAGGLQENTGSIDDCGPVAPPASGGDGSGDGTEGEDGEGDGTESGGFGDIDAPEPVSNVVVVPTATATGINYQVAWEAATEGEPAENYEVTVQGMDAYNNDIADALNKITTEDDSTNVVIPRTWDEPTFRVEATVIALNAGGVSEAIASAPTYDNLNYVGTEGTFSVFSYARKTERPYPDYVWVDNISVKPSVPAAKQSLISKVRLSAVGKDADGNVVASNDNLVTANWNASQSYSGKFPGSDPAIRVTTVKLEFLNNKNQVIGYYTRDSAVNPDYQP